MTQTSDPHLPVDSFREAAPLLRRPFTAAAVKFKIQSSSKDGSKHMCVAYIDARLVVERLNLVCPHLWHDEYRPIAGGQMWCDLTVDGIKRSDVGEGAGKGMVSDSLKRAAVRFGIGVSLYAIPTQWLSGSDVRPVGKSVFITDSGERKVRAAYTKWLTSVGKQAFGEPLDHGDVEGSQGDADTTTAEEPTDPVMAEPEATVSITDAVRINGLIGEALAVGTTGEELVGIFQEAGAHPEAINKQAVANLTLSQAEAVEAKLSALLPPVEAPPEELTPDEVTA